MSIYCLITAGGSLNDEVADYLFMAAHEVMDRKDRKQRIDLAEQNLSGEIMTDYKVGFMGTIAGVVFHANFDWTGGSIKTDFIVRPMKDREEFEYCKWIKTPTFPVMAEPILN